MLVASPSSVPPPPLVMVMVWGAGAGPPAATVKVAVLLDRAIVGSVGANTIIGGSGNDTIDGAGGPDVIDAGAGNDAVIFHGTETAIDGGTGADTLTVATGATVTAVNFAVAAGLDQTVGDAANVTNFENLDASAVTAALTVTGSSAANVITTGSGNDTIDGGGGADVINSGGGNDTVSYYGSESVIDGGAGNNTLLLRAVATINLGNVDQTTGDATSVANFQNVDASGLSSSVSVTGSSAANIITTGAGNDTIDGAGGADVIGAGAATTRSPTTAAKIRSMAAPEPIRC